MAAESIDEQIPENLDNCISYCPSHVLGAASVAELCMRTMCTGPVRTEVYREDNGTLISYGTVCPGASQHQGVSFEDGNIVQVTTRITSRLIEVKDMEGNVIPHVEKVIDQNELRVRAAV